MRLHRADVRSLDIPKSSKGSYSKLQAGLHPCNCNRIESGGHFCFHNVLRTSTFFGPEASRADVRSSCILRSLAARHLSEPLGLLVLALPPMIMLVRGIIVIIASIASSPPSFNDHHVPHGSHIHHTHQLHVRVRHSTCVTAGGWGGKHNDRVSFIFYRE